MKDFKKNRDYIEKRTWWVAPFSDEVIRKAEGMIAELWRFFEEGYKLKFEKEMGNPLILDKVYEYIKKIVWNGINDCRTEFLKYCSYLNWEDKTDMLDFCEGDLLSFCEGWDVFDAWRRCNMWFYKDVLIFLINQADNVVKLQYKQYDVPFENAAEDNVSMMLNTLY